MFNNATAYFKWQPNNKIKLTLIGLLKFNNFFS